MKKKEGQKRSEKNEKKKRQQKREKKKKKSEKKRENDAIMFSRNRVNGSERTQVWAHCLSLSCVVGLC